MLAIRKNITDKIIAIILLIALTVSDFLFVGKSIVSYALDVIKTNNSNVELTAYFLDENGMKVEKIAEDINNEETQLFVEVAVKNEGYFNGKILLNNNNFNIEQVGSNEYVEKVESNEVTLKQINAGTTALIELKVTSIKDDLITVSKLFGETSILLEGKYIDGASIEADTYIPVQGETKVEINWKSNENINIELNAKLLTNYIYKENNENKRVAQILINSKLKDNNYPAKNTEISLNVPKNAQEVKVHTRDNSATNANQIFNENNYEYDEINHSLNIKLTNEDENNISWKKNAEDIIVVTYVFDSNEPIENPNITITGKIQTYDEKDLTATKNVMIDTQLDGITSFESKVQEEAIYKGKLYTKEARDYKTLTRLYVDYANVEETISIKEKESIYLSDRNPITANIFYKQIEIKKEELTKIFGENGYITIKDENGTILANLNKESNTNENGYIVVPFMQGVKSIEITTSKPEKVGILNIIKTKEILNTEYEKNTIDTLTAIRETSEAKGAQIEKEIALLNTTTDASLEIENAVISENNKELTLIATLNSSSESKSLYKNPSVTITLPEGVTATSAQYGVLYKNGLEIESCVVNNTDRSRIEIKLAGEQVTYDVSGGTKIYVKIPEMELAALMPSQTSNIEMTYTNENTNTTSTITKEIKIETQYGLILYNEVSGYKDEEKMISKDLNTLYGNLDMNVGSKSVNLRTALVNNFGQPIENVAIVGKIPAGTNNSTFRATLNSVYVDNQDAQILYSSNENATADDDTWGEYTQDAKAYKIALKTMEPMQALRLATEAVIPENLGYNEVGTFDTNITYDLNNLKQSEDKQIILTTETSTQVFEEKAVETKTETGLDVSILSTVGNDVLEEGSDVYEGQKIKYIVKITNNTGRDYSNVKVKAIQNNGYAWGIVEEDGRIHYDYNTYEDTKIHYYRVKDSNESDEVIIDSLKDGESHEYIYEATTYLLNDKNINGKETYGTIYITGEDNLNEVIPTVKNEIKQSELKVDIYSISNEEYIWYENTIKYMSVVLNNLRNTTIKNGELQITLCKEFEVSQDQYESVFTYNEENLAIKRIEKNNNDETVVTFDILNINPNDTEKIDIYIINKSIENETSKLYATVKVTTEEKNTYKSKFEKEIIKSHSNMSANLIGFVNGKNITEDTHVRDEDIIEFVSTLSNDDKNNEIDMLSTLTLDDSLEIQSIKLIQNNTEKDITSEIEGYVLDKEVHLMVGETAKINVIAKVNGEFSSNAINELRVIDEEYGTLIADNVTFSVDSQEDIELNNEEKNNKPVNNIQTNQNEIQENDYIQSNNQIETIKEKYTITGTVWIDENKDGSRNDSEARVSQIKVSALDMESNKIVSTINTNEQGQYTFKLSEGKYAIIFYYDSEQYVLTTYKAEGTNEEEDSDAITRTIELNEQKTTVALTDTLILNDNVEHIDLGLKNKDTFDLNLQKYVNKITVTNNEGTITYDQEDDTKLAKTEIKAKYLKDSLVIVEYKIKVSNVGDIEGYAKNIEDKLPAGLTFNSSMNPTWYKDGDKLYNTSLANTLIKPGETKELTLILTKTMTESNTGLVHNTAQIISSGNSKGIADKTEETASADVIISVSTGALINYVVIVLNIIILLGLASYIFVKYLIKKI